MRLYASCACERVCVHMVVFCLSGKRHGFDAGYGPFTRQGCGRLCFYVCLCAFCGGVGVGVDELVLDALLAGITPVSYTHLTLPTRSTV